MCVWINFRFLKKLQRSQSSYVPFTQVQFPLVVHSSNPTLKKNIIYLFGAPGLSCGMWDLVSWPWMEPGLPVLGAWVLSHGTTTEVPNLTFLWLFVRTKKPTPGITISEAAVTSLRRVQLLATPRTVACQTLPSMGFSRKEYWSRLPFPSPGDLPNSGIKSGSPALQADSLLIESPGNPYLINWTPDLIWISPNCPLMSTLFVQGSNPAFHISLRCHTSFVSSGLWPFLCFSLLLVLLESCLIRVTRVYPCFLLRTW